MIPLYKETWVAEKAKQASCLIRRKLDSCDNNVKSCDNNSRSCDNNDKSYDNN